MVRDAGNAPVVTSGVFYDGGFTDRGPEHLSRKLVAGVGVAPTEAELMKLA